jgi:hypothetical protein
MEKLKILEDYASVSENLWLAHSIALVKDEWQTEVSNTIRERAANKAMARIISSKIAAREAKRDIEQLNTGIVGLEDLVMIYNGHKKEIEIWYYIQELIEKSGKL